MQPAPWTVSAPTAPPPKRTARAAATRRAPRPRLVRATSSRHRSEPHGRLVERGAHDALGCLRSHQRRPPVGRVKARRLDSAIATPIGTLEDRRGDRIGEQIGRSGPG
ncbi:MAG: hypothetical protein EBS39_08550 [Gammaproteobacteria bacterium]|nr:hypothetical protein [Gammaproteobacteria bacterium]